MQFWFAHGVEVTLREQLVTQVILGILCHDLHPGERLPSTRELARRFRLHPNTISAGYRQLEQERWIEFRHGSGVYVREVKPEVPLSPALALDQLLANLFRSARGLGVPLSTLRSRLHYWLELQPPDHFLLIEPAEELARIVALEMHKAVALPVQTCGLNDKQLPDALHGAIPVALPSRAMAVRKVLPAGTELLTLRVRSIPSSLAEWLPAPSGALVGIASRWPDLLKVARTMLIAAGFHPDSLVFRDARKPRWQRGLEQTAAVVCDSVTAGQLPRTIRTVVFPLLSDTSLQELRRFEEFLRNRIDPSV